MGTEGGEDANRDGRGWGEGERAEGAGDTEMVRQKTWREQRAYPEEQAQRGLVDSHTDMTPTVTCMATAPSAVLLLGTGSIRGRWLGQHLSVCAFVN